MNANRIIWWVENDSDKKYLPILFKGMKELGRSVNVYYRSEGKLYMDNGEVMKFNTPPELFRWMNEEKSLLITGYNTRKRDVHEYKNIKVIQLSHSMSGWTGYHVSTIVSYYDNMVCIYPEIFDKMIKPNGKSSRFKNYDIQPKFFVKDHYRLLYHLDKKDPVKNIRDEILFLPHWTTPLPIVHEILGKCDVNKKITIKLHPAETMEENIFMNRQVTIKSSNKLIKDKFKDKFDTNEMSSKKQKKDFYNKMIETIKNDYPNVTIASDTEFELIDAMNSFKYLLFDGCSNTIIEAIARDRIYGSGKSIAVIHPVSFDEYYILPDMLGYKFLDKVTSIDDFKKVDDVVEKDLFKNLNKSSIIKNYDEVIYKIIKG